jgi:hypothetical protein
LEVVVPSEPVHRILVIAGAEQTPDQLHSPAQAESSARLECAERHVVLHVLEKARENLGALYVVE